MHNSFFRNIKLAIKHTKLIKINKRKINQLPLAHINLSLNKKLAPYFDNDKKKVVYIKDVKTCRECIDNIKKEFGKYDKGKEDGKANGKESGNKLKTCNYINDEEFFFMGLDMEGYKIGKNGIVSIIQICTKDVYIFDIFQCDNAYKFIEYLKELLENEKIIKITHDCREDCSILHNQYRINITNIFDTQIAYNILLKKEQKEIYQASYDDLLFKFLYLNNTYKIYFHKLVKLNDKIYLKRPISKELIQYAIQDVLYLKPLMYALLSKLEEEREREFKEEKEREFKEEKEREFKEEREKEKEKEKITSINEQDVYNSIHNYSFEKEYFELNENKKKALTEVIEESKKYIFYKFLNSHIENENKLKKGMILDGMVVSTNHLKTYVKLNLNKNGVILNSFNYKCEVGDIIRCVILGFSENGFINLSIVSTSLTSNKST